MFSTIKRALPLLALGGLLAGCGAGHKSGATAASTAAPPPGTVIAVVNGQPVMSSELAAYIDNIRLQGAAANMTPLQRREVAHELVQIVLAAQAAKKEDLLSQRKVQATLALQRDFFLANQAVEHYIETHPPTDQQLKDKYEQVAKAQSGEEYKARHILVKTKAEAEKIIAELNKGGNFAALAKKDSTGPSASRGGELGWFKPDQMVPTFAAAVASLKPGEYTKTPVKTRFGWHVILLEDKRTATPPSFTDTKPLLVREIRRDTVKSYVNQLLAQAHVTWKLPSLATAASAASVAKPASSGGKAAKTTAPASKTH